MSIYLQPEFWDDKIPNLAAAIRELNKKKYCLTTWDAILKIEDIKGDLVRISDPDAVDAGNYISLSDIKCFYNERPQIRG